MNADTLRYVRERAGSRCEYCHLPAALYPAPFQIDHIIARQHGGGDEPDNLAFACIHCNRYKGPNVAGIDPVMNTLTRLFHPRTDNWNHHFEWKGAEIQPLSDIGRVTVSVLFMNDPELILLRTALSSERL